MRISKKILACVLAALMAIAMMPFTASAATAEVNDADSFEAAVAAANAGDTIKLTGDIDLTKYPAYGSTGSMHYIDISGLTVDLNDHTITIGGRWSTLFTGTNGKIMNGTCVGTPSPADYQYGIYVWGPGKGNLANSGGASASIVLEDLTLNYGLHCWNANVTVIDCNVTGSNAYYGVWADENSNVTIESGNFTTGGAAVLGCATSSDGQGHINVEGGNFTVPAGKPLVLPASSSSVPENVQISSGTFKNADDSAYAVLAQNIADGATLTDGVVTQESVAKIGDTYYATLNAALSAVAAGDTVTVLADTTLTTTDVNINKNITIDFGKYTVTAARWPFINNANLTLTGTTGGLVSSRGVIDNYGTLTVNGGVYTSTPTVYPAIYNNPDAETIINGGTINSNNAAVYNEGATVTINGGVLNSGSSAKANSVYYSYCVRNIPGSTCTMNGGTINAVHGGIAAFGNGVDDTTVVVNGGTITTHHSSLGNDAYYPLYISGNGTSMTVNGGTFSGPRTAVLIDDDDIGLTENTSLTITGGTFTAPTGVAAVTRGDNDSYPSISGGYFSTQVPAEFCADGYAAKATPEANGYYTVGASNDGTNITVADEISQNFYLDDDFYGEEAYVAVTYNTNTNVEESATIGTEITRMGDLPSYSSTDAYNGNRVVTITQAPAQVTENVEINVYASQADAEAGTNAVKTLTYSTYDYCTTILDTPDAELGAKATELKELAETTLDYAAAAQTYFNYNTDNMATADATGDFYNNVAGVDLSSVAGISSRPADIKSATVVVKSDLEINLLSKTPVAVNGFSWNATKGGSRFGVSALDEPNGSWYVINIKGIEPANMDSTITISTNGVPIELTANSIMKIMANSSNANMATLAKAMYLYGQAADAYFD